MKLVNLWYMSNMHVSYDFIPFHILIFFILYEGISFKVTTMCIRGIIEMLDVMGFHPINFVFIYIWIQNIQCEHYMY